MRRGSIIGLMMAASMGMVGAMLPPMHMPERIVTPERSIERKRRRDRAVPLSRYWRQPRPAHAATQRHTGAGGAGMHRAWKKRRASGRH